LRPVSAAGGPRRLRVNGYDPMPGLDQRAEDRRGESRRAHEDEV
jgi:hypothetical protein